MEVIIRGEPNEIAALVLAVQGRQTLVEEVGADLAKGIHQELQARLAEYRAGRESQ